MSVAEFRSALIVEVDDKPGCFRLVQELVFFSAILGKPIVVPADYVTDFASIPWVFHSFCQVNGKHRKAAVIHDYLCTHGKELGISQKQADFIFLEAMEVLGVRWSQRRVMYRSVRTYQTIAGWFRGSNTVKASSVLLIACVMLLALSGCMSNTMPLLQGADYVCIKGNVDGPYTDSGATGVGIKLPEGETLTPATIEALCPP